MNKIVIELFAPPALTLFCWLVAKLRARFQHDRSKAMTSSQFWLLLISAYVMLAVALWGAEFFSGQDRGDGSFELPQ